MAGIKAGDGRNDLPCVTVLAARPIILLALGQSNAANHGAPSGAVHEVTLIEDGRCRRTGDPLPGAIGNGGSIWSRLPNRLADVGPARPVVMSVLAVDASSIDEWTHDGSPLASRLKQRLAALHAQNALPHFVLWQQGEADAGSGTGQAKYLDGLRALRRLLDTAGVQAPIVLARSTVCRSPPNVTITAAQDLAIAADHRLLPGPVTDQLSSAQYRPDGCHFSASGLDAASALWATRLKPLLAKAE